MNFKSRRSIYWSVLLLVLALGVNYLSTINPQQREQAYTQLTEILDQQGDNPIAIVEAAETFLSIPFANWDSRQQQVLKFAINTGKRTVDQQTHLDRLLSLAEITQPEFEEPVKKSSQPKLKNAYTQVTDAIERGAEPLEIIERAGKFLSIPFAQLAQPQVVNIFHQAFVQWLEQPEEQPTAIFPVNQFKKLELEVYESQWAKLTERQQQKQALDWLFFMAVLDRELGKTLLRDDLPANDYGKTRSYVLDSDHLIALIPFDSSKEERIDNLAAIADQHRHRLGYSTVIWIFEYQLDIKNQLAQLKRSPDLHLMDLFTKEYGYYEANIKTLDDFKKFIAEIDSLSFAQKYQTHLVLGGRQFKSRQFRRLRVEDLAAIWSANGVGFSLKMGYDYEKLKANGFMTQVTQLLLPFQITGQLSAGLDLNRPKNSLAKNNIKPLLDLIEYLKSSSDESVKQRVNLIEAALTSYQFQVADYHENLQGTEVGMILFYSDLVAKLWAIYPNWVPKELANYQLSLNQETPQLKLLFYPKRQRVQPVGVMIFFAPDLIQVQTPASSMGWNKYYPDIADYEQAFAQLNEILKWSQLIAWLDKMDNSRLLEFLSQNPVNRTHWFPSWVTEEAQRLKFNRWDEIGFFEKCENGLQSEAFRLLDTSLVGGIQDSEPKNEAQASVNHETIGLNLEKMLEDFPQTEIIGQLDNNTYAVKMAGHQEWLILLVQTDDGAYSLQREWREEEVLFNKADYTVAVEQSSDDNDLWKIIAYSPGQDGSPPPSGENGGPPKVPPPIRPKPTPSGSKPLVLTSEDDVGKPVNLTGNVDQNGVIQIDVPPNSLVSPSDLKSRLKRYDVNKIRQQAESHEPIHYQLETPADARDFQAFLNDLEDLENKDYEKEAYDKAVSYLNDNPEQARLQLNRYLVDEYAQLRKFFSERQYKKAKLLIERLKKIYGNNNKQSQLELLWYEYLLSLHHGENSPEVDIPSSEVSKLLEQLRTDF